MTGAIEPTFSGTDWVPSHPSTHRSFSRVRTSDIPGGIDDHRKGAPSPISPFVDEWFVCVGVKQADRTYRRVAGWQEDEE